MIGVWARQYFSALLICGVLLSSSVLLSSFAGAAGVEFLSPQPGAIIMARNPETHLVLRRVGGIQPLKIKVEKTGATVDVTVEMEGEDYSYLHYRLPLSPGNNSFSFIPSGERFDIVFEKIQADLTLKALAKNSYLFHQGGGLPASCTGCHELLETETIEPVGIKKQLGCQSCHQNLIEKSAVKHGPTLNLECLSCHQQSREPLRIGFPSVGTRELCLLCHPGKKGWLARKVTHGPILLGGCTLCHNPHGEQHKYQLWAEGSLDLCILCHSNKEKLVSKDDPVPFVHGIISGSGCVACHDPHAADEEFVLKKPINELCLSCHPSILGLKSGHPVERHPVEGPVDYLRPGRKLVCTSCHEPHGTVNRYYLVETKLGGRLCRGCHKR